MTVGESGGTHDTFGQRHGRDPSKPSSHTALIQAGLARIIEGEILPRLALAHARERPAKPAVALPTPERVAALARDLIAREPDDKQAQKLLDEGLPLDSLLLDLLAPASWHLGYLWEEDEASFIDVTVGLSRLHELARVLCARMEVAGRPTNGRSVLLLPCPGETHRFSLALVASFFREAGWHVVLSNGVDDDPSARVQLDHFDLIGISLSCDVLLPAMAELVAKLRTSSRNPDMRVLVGGPLFLRGPARVAEVGADATATDGRSAVRIAAAMFKS